MKSSLRWRAVYTLSCHEFAARDHLRAWGITTFLPSYTRISRWSDRRKAIETPLFSRYVFIQCIATDLHLANSCRGVALILGEPIPDDVIETLRRVTREPGRVSPADYTPGEPITVTRGPFAGISGIVERSKGVARLIISIEVLGRACAVEIAAEDLERDYRRRALARRAMAQGAVAKLRVA